MFYFTALCALALGAHAHGKHQHVPFDAIFGTNFLASHDLTESAFHELMHGETLAAVQSAHHAATPHSYLACGPVSELKSKRASMLSTDASLADKHVRTVYQSRTRSTGCLLVHAPRTVLEAASVSPYRTESDSHWTFSIVPAFLKVSPSVTSFLSGQTEKMDALLHSKSKEGPVVSEMGYILEASVALGALHNAPAATHLERLSATMRGATHGTESALHRTMSTGWRTLAADFGARDSCRVQADHIHARAGSIILTHAHEMSRACLTAVVEALAADPSVNNIRLSPEPRVLNHDAKGMLESGQPAQTGTGGAAVYPYSQAGLTGAGQIVAVMDTGLDDLSCLFADDICSEGTGECLTPRDGQVYNDRRKVIQYVPYADETDYEAGHGSHVTGSVLGAGILISQPDEFGSLTNSLQGYNGVATDAKVAFQDIGDAFGNLGVLNYVSLSEEAFPVAYRAGARIHSDSWGGGIEYDQQSFEVDMYSYENDDFLVVIAAGNDGNIYGLPIIGAPSNAKNSLSVGSAQVRNEFSDKPFDATTMSYFSSIGPTPEGRIKPDIVSTGSFVSSCRSNDPIFAEWAYFYDYAQVTCSTMQISGTSMATPVTAGGALLVRQYFEDESFWAARCGSEYSTCAAGAFSPSGYFVKAAMMHSGEPIARFGSPNNVIPVSLSSTPNVYEGYGYATLSNVLPLEGLGQDFKLYPNDALKLAEGEQMRWSVTIPSDSTVALRATLVWYDPYGEFSGNLIHNLDLTIEGPSGEMYYGNNNVDGDDKNPNEQVTIWDTSCDQSSCVFNVTVSAVSVSLTEEQKFALIISTAGEVSEPERSEASVDAVSGPFDFKFSKTAPLSFDQLKAQAKSVQSQVPKRADRKLKASNAVAAMSRSLGEDITSVTVQLDPFMLENSEDGDYKVSFEMDGSLGLLQSIDFEFNKWDSTDVCPYVTNWRIETNGDQSVSAAQWPLYFTNCLFGWLFPFTTGVYTSTYGAAYDGIVQEEAGTWDMYFYTYSDSGPISYEDVTVTFNFEPQPEYLEFSTGEVVIDREEDSFEIEVTLPEGETCYRPQYAWMNFTGGDCESNFDLFLTDAQSRVTPVTYQYDFTFTTEGVVNFIDESTLRGGGTYTLGVVVQEFDECPSATFAVTVAMRATPCEEELTSDTVRSTEFRVQVDSCAVIRPDYVGDGYCDWDTPGGYNTPGCGFDGGDCCEESCVNAYFPCGYNGYFCKDPEFTEFSGSYAYNDDDDDDDDDDSTCHVGVEAWIGDGYCDGGNYNTAACNWDGGDCCEDTCEDTEENTCGVNGYNCLADAYSAEYSGLDSIGVYSAAFSDQDDDIVLESHRRLLELELSFEYSADTKDMVYSMEYSQAAVFSDNSFSSYSFSDGSFSDGSFSDGSFSDGSTEGDDYVYSSTYSNNNPYDNPVVLIDRFVQQGNLEYVTLTLDGLETYFANYALGVLVVDPLTRFVQLGSLNSFSYFWPNSGSQTWPGSWTQWESSAYSATRDVRAAGLSSLDYSNLRDGSRRLEESSVMHAVERVRSAALRKDHLKARSKGEKMSSKRMLEGEEDYWEVYILLATNEHEVMNFTFSGLVEMKFDTDATVAPTFSPTAAPTAEPTLVPTSHPTNVPTLEPTAVPTLAPTARPTQAGETNSPTVVPTFAPTRAPTRRPTRTPTRRPTGPVTGTYIEFNTTIEYDGVECDDFTTDDAALEAARQATLTSLNENMADDEVKPGVPEQCARRRLRYSNLDVQVVKRGLATVTMVSFTTRANINNLGESDPEAVYDDMKESLNDDIESGDYTTLVIDNGQALGTSTLDSVSITQLPTYSELVVFEVEGDSSSSSSGDDDEETNIIIGCVIGGFFFLVIVAGAVYWFHFREADDNMSGAKNTSGASSTNSAHTATVGSPNKGSYKKGSTNDDMHDNPIFTKGESGGKAADNYGGL